MRIKVIINPKSKSGNHKDLKAVFKEKFARHLLDIEQTAYPQHATHIAGQAAKENVDIVVAVGGDGTVNEVLNGIAGTNVALGIIPTGTANDLATLYKIPADIDRACEVILKRRLKPADLISVNDRYYVTSGGLGFPCQVVRIANKIKHRTLVGKLVARILGSKLYILAVFCAILKKTRTADLLSVQWNGSSIKVDPLWVMISNQAFLGKNFLISPGAVNNDGMFDLCLVENRKNRFQALSIVKKVIAGRHVYSPCVKTWRANELILKSEKPVPFFGDGELFGQKQKFSIKIMPGALKLIVPEAISGA